MRQSILIVIVVLLGGILISSMFHATQRSQVVLPPTSTSVVVERGDFEAGAAFVDHAPRTLFGSSSNLVSLPISGVEANSTTTDAGNATSQLADGGFAINQYIATNGISQVVLLIQAIGGSGTSTMYIKQMGSADNTNWFEIGGIPTTTSMILASDVIPTATTTLTVLNRAFTLIPGTATTTLRSYKFDTKGYANTRFIFHGDDVANNISDGVQAFVQAFFIEEFVR